MYQETSPVVCLQVHLEGEQMITCNKNMAPNLQAVLEQNAAKDSKLTAYFKASIEYPEARETLYQDFPSKFVSKSKKCKWELWKGGFAIG